MKEIEPEARGASSSNGGSKVGWLRRQCLAVVAAFSKEISGSGLGFFRVAFSFILSIEVSQLLYFKELVYSASPMIEPVETWKIAVTSLWWFAVLFILVGYQTRLACWVSFLCASLTITQFTYWEYHIDYVYIGMSAVMLFAPCGNRFSIDAILRKRAGAPRPNVLVGWHYLFLLVGIGLVYIDSVFYKVTSPMWMKGLGMWLPASLIQANWAPIGLHGQHPQREIDSATQPAHRGEASRPASV